MIAKIKALFKWQQFNFYVQEIELENFSEDADYYFGKPINLKCCFASGNKHLNFGVLAYPKYAWKSLESTTIKTN